MRDWVWSRTGENWPGEPTIIEALVASIELPVLGIALPLAEIYRNMPLR